MAVFNRVFMAFLLAALLAAAPAPAEAGRMVVTADRLEMDDRKQTAVFTGKVHSIDGKMVLDADQLTVRYAAAPAQGKKKATGKQVREILAVGRVVINQPPYLAEADRARFKDRENTLVLIGKGRQAWIKNGQDKLVGDEIVLELTDKREIKKITADGGKRRVSFSFTSKSEQKKEEKPQEAPVEEQPQEAPAEGESQ